jgi:hypothetical protein
MNCTARGARMVDARCYCDRCEGRTQDTYSLDGRCNNCGWTFLVRCRKGDSAPLSVTCPRCEVNVYGWRR